MKKIPKSIRKYIRKEKARIRREFLSIQEQEERVKTLYESLSQWYKKGSAENV